MFSLSSAPEHVSAAWAERGAAWITRSNSAPTILILGFTNRSNWCWYKVHHDHNKVRGAVLDSLWLPLNFIKFSWNCSLKFSQRQNFMKFYICSSVIMVAFASEGSGAERWAAFKNGRSVERSVERDATERAWATERQIDPLRSAPLTCSGRHVLLTVTLMMQMSHLLHSGHYIPLYTIILVAVIKYA